MQFGSAKVREPDFDPAIWSTDRADAKPVAVADIAYDTGKDGAVRGSCFSHGSANASAVHAHVTSVVRATNAHRFFHELGYADIAIAPTRVRPLHARTSIQNHACGP